MRREQLFRSAGPARGVRSGPPPSRIPAILDRDGAIIGLDQWPSIAGVDGNFKKLNAQTCELAHFPAFS
jgi:hypothetical protein